MKTITLYVSYLKEFLNRREIPALIVALLLVFLKPLAEKSGLTIPDAQFAALVLAGFAFFGLTFAEGVFKLDYDASWKTLLSSKKLQSLLAAIVVVALNSFLPVQYHLSEDTIMMVVQFLVALMTVKSGVDIVQAVQ